MNETILFWATVASPLISAVAIIVALCIARSSEKNAQKQIDEIRLSAEKQINALKDVIEHQGHIEWGRLEYYRMLNEFELVQDKMELAYINIQIENAKKTIGKRNLKDLKLQAQIYENRIKNREILLDNFKTLFKNVDQTTTSILFDAYLPETEEIKTCHRMADFPPES